LRNKVLPFIGHFRVIFACQKRRPIVSMKITFFAVMAGLILGGCGGGTPADGTTDAGADQVFHDGDPGEVDQHSSDQLGDLDPLKDLPGEEDAHGGDLADAPGPGDLGEILPETVTDADAPDGDSSSSAPLPPKFLMMGLPAGGGFMRTGSLKLTFQVGPASPVEMRSPGARLKGLTVLRSR
jgi:hypothetical protein